MSIGADAEIGPRVRIGAGCSIGAHVTIGEDTVLHPRVSIYERVSVGARCVIHSGAVIGADGFGFEQTDGEYRKVPQVGTVEIADDVEIGANTCIDRAALGVTSIGVALKLDNMVHIAHNCRVGSHVVIAAQTGFAGGVSVGDYAVVGGQVGVGDKARIEPKAVIGSGAGILTSKIVRAGEPGAVNACTAAPAISGSACHPGEAGETPWKSLMLVVAGGHSRNIGKTSVVCGISARCPSSNGRPSKSRNTARACVRMKVNHASAPIRDIPWRSPKNTASRSRAIPAVLKPPGRGDRFGWRNRRSTG